MAELDGKVALITGAQQGIGAAIARAFAAAGADVVINYLDDKAGADAVAAAVRACGRRAELAPGDVREDAAIDAMLEAAEALGGIGILVNNAAVFPRVEFLEMTAADWDGLMGINLRAPFLLSVAAARRMVRAGTAGAILNLSSGAAFRGSPRGVHYVTSKAGILGLTRATARELAGHGVRVNAIAPGLTDTAQPRYGMDEAEIADVAAGLPLAGLSLPEDIADLAVFLCSEAARRITGQCVHVNGGDYLT